MATRYPLEPLAAALHIELGNPGGDSTLDEPRGLTALGELLGYGPRGMRRLRQIGLSERQADRAAIALGRHPCSIWPAWWINTPDTDDDEASADYFADDDEDDQAVAA